MLEFSIGSKRPGGCFKNHHRNSWRQACNQRVANRSILPGERSDDAISHGKTE
ncbi:hypothetical protein RBSWK_05546 [Rhodopirellula baltica SWK14]|uniref:Uncharacterized protein n=1 Tax=Rhodopirellula baltica SWK14 TaxID=993516 RepID=L7C914_RHOBT|nr:hypothetical protein RBSWK_05546 [Rhodopirellula baltica SWK14]